MHAANCIPNTEIVWKISLRDSLIMIESDNTILRLCSNCWMLFLWMLAIVLSRILSHVDEVDQSWLVCSCRLLVYCSPDNVWSNWGSKWLGQIIIQTNWGSLRRNWRNLDVEAHIQSQTFIVLALEKVWLGIRIHFSFSWRLGLWFFKCWRSTTSVKLLSNPESLPNFRSLTTSFSESDLCLVQVSQSKPFQTILGRLWGCWNFCDAWFFSSTWSEETWRVIGAPSPKSSRHACTQIYPWLKNCWFIPCWPYFTGESCLFQAFQLRLECDEWRSPCCWHVHYVWWTAVHLLQLRRKWNDSNQRF